MVSVKSINQYDESKIIIKNNLDSFSAFTTLQVGTGVGTSYKKFATLFKYLSNSQTELNFGKLPYRDNEPMKSIADIKDLKKIGWSPVTTLEEGFKEIIAH